MHSKPGRRMAAKMQAVLSPSVGHVYQIISGWDYAKSNLWASLMHTVFFELNRQAHSGAATGAKTGTTPR